MSERIRQTPLLTHPCAHLEIDSPFDPEFYPEIIENLPAGEYYRELKHYDATLPDGRSARLKFDLLRANIHRLPGSQKAFWNEMAAQLKSPVVNAAYSAKFAPVLEKIKGRPQAKIKINAFPVLFRDIAGYQIKIHPDSARKAITTQFYLPEDDSQLHLGTLFHERQPDGSFDEGKVRQFAPNTGYAFGVTPDSWHSVRQMGPDDKPRNTLMIIFYYDRGWIYENLKNLRGYLRGVYDQVRGTSSPDVYE
ncbi:MAG: hypothetical protein GWN24_20005 [Nitrospinaceae bacterium]|nr:hypothetical protein [Nitrospinaceae bacterium]